MIAGIETKITRSKKRKSIGFEVIPGSIVKITAPESTTDIALEAAIKSKESWIHRQVEETNKILLNQKIREYVSGESFPLMGKEYRLKVIRNVTAPVTISGERIIVSIAKDIDKEDENEVIRASIVDFYKSQALIKFDEVIKRYSYKIGVEPATVGIKEYKNAWGMCTKDKEVYINWRVVMAPISVIKYVIVHELCHLAHADHSKDFWSLVRSQITDIDTAKKWLKYNQKAIEL